MQLLRNVSPPREAASHTDICCLSVYLRSPVPPRLRGLLQRLSSLGGGYQSERGERRIPVDTSVLLPAGIGVFYALLILVSLKLTAQKSKAVHIGSAIAEMILLFEKGRPLSG